MKVQKKTQLIMPGFPIFYEKNVLLLKKKKKKIHQGYEVTQKTVMNSLGESS